MPPKQLPNQQCAEARALLWGLKFILNAGIREAHLFGDNAAALVQFLRCKGGCGKGVSAALAEELQVPLGLLPGLYCVLPPGAWDGESGGLH